MENEKPKTLKVLETKPAIQSATLVNISFGLGIFIVSTILEGLASPDTKLILTELVNSLAPDFIDPFVPKAYDWLTNFLTAYFGFYRAAQSRIAIGDIQGVWKKKET